MQYIHALQHCRYCCSKLLCCEVVVGTAGRGALECQTNTRISIAAKPNTKLRVPSLLLKLALAMASKWNRLSLVCGQANNVRFARMRFKLA